MQRKRIAILGSTGSIGRQTLDVVRQHPDRFEVKVITAGRNAVLLAEQARAFSVPHAVICDTSKYENVRQDLAGTGTYVHAGVDAACDLVTGEEVDIVVGSGDFEFIAAHEHLQLWEDVGEHLYVIVLKTK